MRKFLLSFFTFLLLNAFYLQAQNFEKFLEYFPEKTPPFTIENEVLLNSISDRIDGDLAWKYIWDENEFQKPEETFCYPIAQYMMNDKILVIIYSQGEPGDVLFYTATIKTFNIKKQESIDEFPIMMVSFNEGGELQGSIEVNADGSRIEGININNVFNEKEILATDIKKNGYLEYE